MESRKQEILKYYDELAFQYDEDRFSNTYGQFIHKQETEILKHYFRENINDQNLDLACGTGRFLDFASYGVDVSPNMVKVASDKYPSKQILLASGEQLMFEDGFFDNVYSFHLFMHLEIDKIQDILKEVHRTLKPGGKFIFDIPSQKRRKLTRYKPVSWHGGTHLDYQTIDSMTSQNWGVVSFHGIAFLPIHHIPQKIRKYFIKFDKFMCSWLFKEWSSHLVFVLKKK